MKILLLIALFPLAAFSQTRHSVALGVGSANILDTYLSPYDYKGTNLHFQRETDRQVRAFGIDNLQFQTLLDVDASFVENPGKNVNEYAGGLRYALGWTKQLKSFQIKNSTLTLSAGPMMSAYFGGIYNERNGNNPGQAKVDMIIDATAIAAYSFTLWKKPMTASYQLIWPIVGLAFSPNYGQSYYEAFLLDNNDHNILFAHPGNMPSLRHRITLDIPLRKTSQTSLRIAYLGYFMQSTFNNLKYHSYTNTFLIGITKTFKRL